MAHLDTVSQQPFHPPNEPSQEPAAPPPPGPPEPPVAGLVLRAVRDARGPQGSGAGRSRRTAGEPGRPSPPGGAGADGRSAVGSPTARGRGGRRRDGGADGRVFRGRRGPCEARGESADAGARARPRHCPRRGPGGRLAADARRGTEVGSPGGSRVVRGVVRPGRRVHRCRDRGARDDVDRRVRMARLFRAAGDPHRGWLAERPDPDGGPEPQGGPHPARARAREPRPDGTCSSSGDGAEARVCNPPHRRGRR